METQNMNKQIETRIAELRKENKTYILFQNRYLLEGETVSLSRDGDMIGYEGERIIDYKTTPPKVIDINGVVFCSNLEKLFEEDVNGN